MKNIIASFLMVAALGFLAPAANATIAVSSVSVAGVPLIAAPTSPQVVVVRSVMFCNDTATAMCVQLKDGSTVKTMLCAAAQACANTPALSGANQQTPINGLAGYLGEQFVVTGAFTVASSTPAALGAGGVSVTADYFFPALR